MRPTWSGAPWRAAPEADHPAQVVQELLPKSAANTVRKVYLAAREDSPDAPQRKSGLCWKNGYRSDGPLGCGSRLVYRFCPVDAPQVAVAIVIEHGGAGAAAAAPVGAEIMLKALQMSE